MSYHGTGYDIGKKISRTHLEDLLASYAMAEGVESGRDGSDGIALKALEYFENLIAEKMK